MNTMKIEIIEYNSQNNTVIADVGNGNEIEQYEFGLADHIKPQFIKVGPAEATIKDGVITFIKSGSSEKKPFKPFSQVNKPSGFQGANTSYKPKQDDSAFGKCKHAYLVEAFKLGKELTEELESECEAWARASMRVIQENGK